MLPLLLRDLSGAGSDGRRTLFLRRLDYVRNKPVETEDLVSIRANIPRRLLEEVFGFTTFRGPQEAIIDRVMAGGDALVIMPAGSSKSLCFQIPAMLRRGTGVVVSPLIALMDDQVSALTQLGVRAAALYSGLERAESETAWRRLCRGELDLRPAGPDHHSTGLERTSELDGKSRQLRRSRSALQSAH